ncbi:RES domain-containing protein [Tsukamurella sp. NPDC003166]|uniref:RES domain-containing protein n=1 Tax=Tsukamurella sp. NPDC003166 TaxID=3154444 RepID=UPI0033AC4415
MRLFRNADRRYPFLWESGEQPPGRWHGVGAGPVQYLADTPDGAWAEFLRHEEITEVEDLAGVSRALWCIDIDLGEPVRVDLPESVLVGGVDSYAQCRAAAGELRAAGATAITAPSAALMPGSAGGQRVSGGAMVPGPECDGAVVVAFGAYPDAEGWCVVEDGRPPAWLLDHIRAR